MQYRENEPSAWAQAPYDRRQRAVKVVNIGEAEAAHGQVEGGGRHSRAGRTRVRDGIDDSERIPPLGLLGHPDQPTCNVHSYQPAAAAGQFASYSPVAACQVQDVEPSTGPVSASSAAVAESSYRSGKPAA